MLRYPVTLTTDDGRVLVSFPDVPGALTYGDDRDEALTRAVDALATVFGALMKDRAPIPRPSPRRRGPAVTLPPLMGAKVELYTAMLDQQIGKAELGRRLHWHLPQVDRVLNMTHASRVDQLEHALEAVGKRLELHVV